MSIDLEQQLRAYGTVLDDAVPGAPRSRPRRVQLLAAAVIVIVLGAGALVIAARDDAERGIVADDVTTTTAVTVPVAPELVATIPATSVRPLAVAGGDVWLDAGKVDGGDRINHRIERRDARTGAVLATVEVPQEAVFGIAAGNDAAASIVYLAGGDDGAGPQTTVSAVDVSTNTVLFTHTLTEASCSCPIVAGAGGLWLGGNGTDYVLRLDPNTGELVARIELPGPAGTLAALEHRLLVGLTDENTFVVIDPRTNTVEWNRRAELTDPEPEARIATIAAARHDGSGHNAWILRTDGKPFIVAVPSGIGSIHPFDFAPRDAVDTARGLVAVGGDRVAIRTESDERMSFRYDAGSQTFEPAPAMFAPASFEGFEQIVAVDDTLWIYDWQNEVLVVRL